MKEALKIVGVWMRNMNRDLEYEEWKGIETCMTNKGREEWHVWYFFCFEGRRYAS